jgi:hypothetical protein
LRSFKYTRNLCRSLCHESMSLHDAGRSEAKQWAKMSTTEQLKFLGGGGNTVEESCSCLKCFKEEE